MMFTVILSVAKDLASFVISQSPRTDNRSFVAEFTLSEAEGLLRMTTVPSFPAAERVSGFRASLTSPVRNSAKSRL